MKRLLTTFFLCSSLLAQTIAEKKESLHKPNRDFFGESCDELHLVNETLEEKHFELNTLYERAAHLFSQGASEESYSGVVQKIRSLKEEIQQIQEMWRKEAASLGQSEEYALWHQPDTTLFQLVMDYGAADYIYLVPPEVGSIRFSLHSSLPIPRESWSECLELILAQYGVGVRPLNAYLRELYFFQNSVTAVKLITDSIEQLDLLSGTTRVCFVLSPDAADPRGTFQMLQRFSDLATTSIEMLSGKIFLTGPVESIQELLKLHSFVHTGNGLQEFQLVTLNKIDASEMETILNMAFFQGSIAENDECATLRVVPLANLSQSLFLSGTPDEIKKALKLIQDVENNIEDPQEKTVFWYLAKHSDAEELASVLARVYDLLTDSASSTGSKKGEQTAAEKQKMIVAAATIKPGEKKASHKTADGQNNFIVDPKTGAIIMVVEQDALPKIKELLKKLDVPKKMVQIEVLLFEKKMINQNKFGLNLLRLGSDAMQKNAGSLLWNTASSGASGILDFLMSRSKGSGIPAYDVAYQFLMGQEDVQINASPSVTTMNQTPATIAIVEEISIDAGVNDKNNHQYSRAQYGIIMEITPTINMDESAEEETGFITLETDITFDTTKKSASDRPDVTRRHIKNHVRIADGQTVILGGLRRKNTQDNKESIPFLGEIPGIGKLFSSTGMSDSSTEMFVFITPKIINDPVEEAEQLKRAELRKRPGDVPEFLHELLEAKSRQKRRLFEGSLTALFGREEQSVSRKMQGEYDGK